MIIIGSQAALTGWPDAPPDLRRSAEIDAYPANAREWEARHKGLIASEEINALFGTGSLFATEFGFYIDGVDEHTAHLPPDWQARAIMRTIDDEGTRLHAAAPAVEDLVVSKLWRLDSKDKEFVAICVRERSLSIDDLKTLFLSTGPEADRAAVVFQFLNALAAGRPASAVAQSQY